MTAVGACGRRRRESVAAEVVLVLVADVKTHMTRDAHLAEQLIEQMVIAGKLEPGARERAVAAEPWIDDQQRVARLDREPACPR